MQRVLVMDKNRKPLMPCQPARARKLLKQGKASVLRRYPFTIILKERAEGQTQPIQIKLDSGAKTTGIALIGQFKRGLVCLWAANLLHRGFAVRDNLLKRHQRRRNRRYRKARYRQPRFLNRRKGQGWLPPSILSRLNNILTWIVRLRQFSPISQLALEFTKFDTQALQNPEISGIEYQQGKSDGYEIREYLLLKWGHRCAYCDKGDVPFEVEHIVPKSRGGSNSVSNLTISCHECNEEKGNRTATEYGYPNIQTDAERPLVGAAVMNSLRWNLYAALQLTGLPLELGTGGQTKFNRIQQNYSKAHWIDAACVGESGQAVIIYPKHLPILIVARGRQCRQMVLSDKYGFPRTKAKSSSSVHGFRTGDIVRAIVSHGKNMGRYCGRVAVRAVGSFNINIGDKTIQSISYRYCQVIHASDGYSYEKGINASSLPQVMGNLR